LKWSFHSHHSLCISFGLVLLIGFSLYNILFERFGVVPNVKKLLAQRRLQSFALHVEPQLIINEEVKKKGEES
jgi:hypothetical protein